jgi:hypothetical protein
MGQPAGKSATGVSAASWPLAPSSTPHGGMVTPCLSCLGGET